MKFQQIRSATAIITYGGVRFLIDPWLSEKDAYPPIPGSPHPELRCPIHELPMPVEKIMEVDAVIATHLHFDHFDETAIRILPKTLPVFVQDEVDASTLLGYGFQDVRVLKFGGGNSTVCNSSKPDAITVFPAERRRYMKLSKYAAKPAVPSSGIRKRERCISPAILSGAIMLLRQSGSISRM